MTQVCVEPRLNYKNPTPKACLVAETLGGLLSESDLGTHAFELLDKAPLAGILRILLLGLDEVVTAEFFVRLASFECKRRLQAVLRTVPLAHDDK